MANTKLEVIGVKPTKSHSRKGDIAELKAVTFLLEKGYEVFRNCGCDGPVDIVAIDKKNNVSLIDVKTLVGNYVTKRRTSKQKKLGVKILGYNTKTKNIKFVNHRGYCNETH